MCMRFARVAGIEVLQKKLMVDKPEFAIEPDYHVRKGSKALVILDEHMKYLRLFEFGFIPPKANNSRQYINARCEGERNQDNYFDYNRAKDIIRQPEFSQAIRNKRCLVVADCFYAGPENNPHLVYVRDRRPFLMGGIYSHWKDETTGIQRDTFALVTVPGNELLETIGEKRSPLILPYGTERAWVRDSHLSVITGLMKCLSPHHMNAYPVSRAINDARNNSRDLVNPIGPRIYNETIASLRDRRKNK